MKKRNKDYGDRYQNVNVPHINNVNLFEAYPVEAAEEHFDILQRSPMEKYEEEIDEEQ